MKKSITLITALVLAVGTAFGANVKKNYDVSDFTAVQLYGAPKLVVSEGNTVSVRVEGDEDLVNLYEVRVVGKILTIAPKDKSKKEYNWNNKKKIQFFVQMPRINALTLFGSGDIIVKDKIKWESKSSVQLNGSGDIVIGQLNVTEFSLVLSGSGDVDIKSVAADKFNAELRGSGDVKVGDLAVAKLNAQLKGSGDITLSKGKVRQADYKLVGSGDVKASGVVADNVNANIAGSGDITCHATQSITGKVTGSGDVSYKGKPSKVEVSKKGFRSM